MQTELISEGDAGLRTTLLALAGRALKGQLTLDELSESLPTGSRQHPFYGDLIDTLFLAVEHLPGKWFSVGVDYDSWYASDEYLELYLDWKLLQLAAPIAKLRLLRDSILASSRLSRESIDARIAATFRF